MKAKYIHLGTDKMISVDIRPEHKAPQAVRSSSFGCRNCLWNSSECKHGSKYIKTEAVKCGRKTVETCGYYSYYD